MSFVVPPEFDSQFSLLLKIEELRDMARDVMAEMDGLKAGSVADVKNGIDISDEVRRVEVKLIREALHASRGSQLQASRLLGLKATTLNAKIKRYHIRVSRDL
jgi:DNA-binding NtrC family response regulator